MYEIDESHDLDSARAAKPGRAFLNHTPVDRMQEHKVPVERPASPDQLAKPRMLDLWRRMLGFYQHELEVQAENRAQMAEDEAFYDGRQWADMDAEVLRERGQEPIVYNVICTALNWVFGTERRTRTDYKVLPRRSEGAKPAERKSEILKYLSDTNRSEFSVSRAFQDATRAGVGWLESGLQDEDEGEPIYDRAERWRNVLWDSTSVEDDLSDSRYVFRHKWVDLDVAKAFFPGRERTLAAATRNASAAGGVLDDHGDPAMDEQEDFATEASSWRRTEHADRDRLRMVEAWFKVPESTPRMKGGDFSGEIFDPASDGHIEEISSGRSVVRSAMVMRMHVMIFTTAGPVYFGRSPYRHNQYPFTPIWAFRRADNGMPYGLVRNLKGMQRDINKRASKALAIMSSNRTIMDEGAVDDLDEFEEEVARPNAIIVKRAGRFLEVDSDRGMDVAHLDMMSRTISLIQSTSGITDENLGRQTNASSGKAIIARQDQGSLATSILFDNLRLARQLHGEKMLSMIEQFMTEAKRFRITNKRGTPSYPAINDGLPENDIVRTKADYIIAEDSWDASLRQAKADQIIAMVTTLAPVAPEIVIVVLDLLLETMDLPNGEEIVKRVRSKTGMLDPDTDLNNPDPETAAILASQAASAQKAQRFEDAEIAIKEAEAAEKAARADKVAREAEKLLAAMPGTSLEQKQQALELAMAMLNARPAIAVADRLLAEASINLAPPPPMPGPMPPEMPGPMPPDQMPPDQMPPDQAMPGPMPVQ